ncbi:Alpha mannopyranosyltransferase [Corynebacterium pseudotuberculosis]|uniref:alpha-(1->6)-mannopyranosyltransferase A n=1 Tax=Corynebacterium pseudotuberculosis TaxID=1719 RepID=UPI0009475214|nr:alpha-(1->6)-mannopyranosyltransferase A [Corynebacterium pseudotuberculosis]APQ54503.1 Alpha mannopyranosyltransferase [Corynebacterium pseudotuberculosis]
MTLVLTKLYSFSPMRTGLIAAILITIGSFGGGAIRNRGGLLDILNLEFLSYGHGAGFSNITLWIGSALFVVAWFLLGRRVVSGHAAVHEVTRTLALWIIPLIFAAPIMSRDIYSYLMQGTLLFRRRFDAYTQGASANPSPLLYEVSHDWRNTTTPYGPLHLWISEGIVRLCGNHITYGIFCFKALSILSFIGIMWAIPKIALSLGSNPAIAQWLGVANPVMVFHLIGGMHNESVMVGLVSIGLVLALRKSVFNYFCAIAIIAIAMSLKATAALALPFVVWIAVAHVPGSEKKTRVFLAAGIVGAIETLAVLAAITWASGASWGWIAALSGNTKVINPLAFPSLVATVISSVGSLWIDPFPFNTVVGVLRILSMVLMALGLVICWWVFRKNHRDAIRGTAAAYAVAFFFNAVTLPWYYASVISLIGTFTPPLWLKKITVGGSIVVAMAFTGSGNHQLYNPVWMVATVIAGWVDDSLNFEASAEGTLSPESS